MNSKLLPIAALVLVCCEGEPPKMPPSVNALPATAEAPAAAAPAESAPAPEAAAPPAGALPACACNCGCNGAAPARDGGAAPVASAAVVAPPPAAAKHNIAGNVATLPKAAASHAIIYLEDAPIEPTAKMSTTITNRMMNFEPFVAVVPAGGKVFFRNEDPFPHNVFSSDNERFNIGTVPQHSAIPRTFKSAGAYTLLCNLHPGMIGYVVVTPSSYFAKADAQGHFVIKDVPPGTYKATAWAPRQQPVTQPVTVSAGDASLDFQLHR